MKIFFNISQTFFTAFFASFESDKVYQILRITSISHKRSSNAFLAFTLNLASFFRIFLVLLVVPIFFKERSSSIDCS